MNNFKRFGIALLALGFVSFLYAAWYRLGHEFDVFFRAWILFSLVMMMSGLTLFAHQVRLEWKAVPEKTRDRKLLGFFVAVGWALVLVDVVDIWLS